MAAAFVGEVALLLVFGTLLVCGAAHLAHPRRFQGALVAADIGSPVTRRAISFLVTAAELAVGGAGLSAVALGRMAGLHAAALAAGLLYGAFAGYAGLLVYRHPGAPCGCSGNLEPATVGTVARATALSLVATSMVAAPGRVGTGSPRHLALALLCAIGLGLALWQAPAASATSLMAGR